SRCEYNPFSGAALPRTISALASFASAIASSQDWSAKWLPSSDHTWHGETPPAMIGPAPTARRPPMLALWRGGRLDDDRTDHSEATVRYAKVRKRSRCAEGMAIGCVPV